MSCLKAGKIFLAKPNLRECEASFSCQDGLSAAAELKANGARWAVVTDQDREAVFHLGKSVYRITPPQVDLVHSIGCGDALCAGLIHAMDRPPKDMVAFAMACGAHAASRPEIASLDKEACEDLARGLEVH
jgi:fructose-1-phosphate kinase PfkB-like protein